MRQPISQIDGLRILNQVQIAQVCGVSTRTVQRWRASGKFPKRRSFAGATRGWLTGEVLEFLQNCPEES